MSVCDDAWNDFVKGLQLIDRDAGYDERVLISAIDHVDRCPTCLAKWEDYKEKTFNPRQAARRQLREVLSPLVAKATGLPLRQISLNTVLGPFAVASLLIMFSATDGRRRIKGFYPENITLEGLLALWETWEKPDTRRPALEDLDA
jgi:hypothetical protein